MSPLAGAAVAPQHARGGGCALQLAKRGRAGDAPRGAHTTTDPDPEHDVRVGGFTIGHNPPTSRPPDPAGLFSEGGEVIQLHI